MKFEINSANIIFCSLLDHKEPKNSGYTGIIFYGIKFSEILENQFIKNFDIKVASNSNTYPGHLINWKTDNNRQVFIEANEKIIVLKEWINISSIYQVTTKNFEDGIGCSAIFAVRTRLKNVLDCTKIIIEISYGTDGIDVFEILIDDAVKEHFSSHRLKVEIH